MGGHVGRKTRGSEGRVQERVREKRAGERRLESWSTRANPHTWGPCAHTPPQHGRLQFSVLSALGLLGGEWVQKEMGGSSLSERGERNREDPLWGRKGGQALASLLRGVHWRTQIRLLCSPLSDDSGGTFFCVSCFSSHPTT